MTTSYADFLASKRRVAHDAGREVAPDAIHSSLFDFQRAIVGWALRKGRAAIFADTGLGKTRMQVEWARLTGERALILAPLAVAQQTIREAAEMGVEVTYARHRDEAPAVGITITNYERLHRFDTAAFGAVVLDESSILKSFSGTTKRALVAGFADTPWRLCCTATPAPNDLEELCNHAHFLGVMAPAEMRSTFFIADSRGEFMRYRLKRHAKAAFFRWLASWAMAVKRPSDLGFDDGAFVLPGLEVRPHFIEVPFQPADRLFIDELRGVTEASEVRRATMPARVQRVIQIVRAETPAYNSGHEHGISERVHAAMDAGEPGSCEEIPGRDEGPSQRTTPRAVRAGRGATDEGEGRRRGVATGQPGEAQGPASEEVRPDAGGVPSAYGGAGRGVCDLRPLRHKPAEHLPAGGPLPCDGQGPGIAVPELQPGTREVQGRSGPASSGGSVPEREQWLIWCGLNAEQDALAKAFGSDCVSVDGRTPDDEKLRLLDRWLAGEVPILISKQVVFGFGMNFQRCARMAFVGIGYSYEQYYQALRRCHRFGQTRVVEAHIVVSTAESTVYNAVLDKERQAAELSGGLLAEVKHYERAELFAGTSSEDDYEPRRSLSLPGWMGAA